MSLTSHVIYRGELRTNATHLASQNSIISDAPTDNMGKGQNFSPTDLTATSLASCMITVMGIAAAKHSIKFTNVSADVLKVMASTPRRISEIHVSLHIHEAWNSKEKKLMEQTALTCPVAQSLHPNILQEIKFEYKEG